MVDSVAHGVLAIENDVPDMKTNSMLKDAIDGTRQSLPMEFTLDGKGALNAGNRTHEHDHHAISHCIKDLTTMSGDLTINDVEVPVQGPEGSFFVDGAMFAEANNVGEHDRRRRALFAVRWCLALFCQLFFLPTL